MTKALRRRARAAPGPEHAVPRAVAPGPRVGAGHSPQGGIGLVAAARLAARMGLEPAPEPRPRRDAATGLPGGSRTHSQLRRHRREPPITDRQGYLRDIVQARAEDAREALERIATWAHVSVDEILALSERVLRARKP